MTRTSGETAEVCASRDCLSSFSGAESATSTFWGGARPGVEKVGVVRVSSSVIAITFEDSVWFAGFTSELDVSIEVVRASDGSMAIRSTVLRLSLIHI